MHASSKSLILGLITFFAVRGEGVAGVPQQERCEAVFADTMSKVNELSKSQGWTVLTYNRTASKFTSSFDPTWRNTVVQVESPSGIQVSILPDSWEVVSFQRNFPEEEYINYDAPPKPKWQIAQATDKAKNWVKVLLGRSPDNIGKPRAEYTPLLNLPKYHEGTWTVSWPRIDAQGHPFTQDVINVTLSEKFGIIAYAYIFGSKYNDGQKLSVSHDQAIKVGRPAAQKLLGSPLTADWSAGMSLLPAATAQLWIVNPNHMLQYNSIEEVATAGSENTARLAWIVEYRASNDKGIGRYVDVWVDTETKAILGGDFRG